MVEPNHLPEPNAPRPEPAPPADPPGAPEVRDGPAPTGELLHSEVRYDRSDASFWWVFGVVVAGAIVLGVFTYVIHRFFHDYAAYQAEIKKSPYTLAPEPATSLPPEPRLEQLNRLEEVRRSDVYIREESKEKVLASYGPAGSGYVHIPIDRAMDRLAGKLPVRDQQPSEEQARRQNGLVDAGASNSGRMFRGKEP
jgi:hypothetical protein